MAHIYLPMFISKIFIETAKTDALSVPFANFSFIHLINHQNMLFARHWNNSARRNEKYICAIVAQNVYLTGDGSVLKKNKAIKENDEKVGI